ncbi:hypothetical protein [uncultured Chryseobacterium sp.]|uniref:hypothetical protein n=1 Tax=uncultured Chryseobacterium sp. TaxID=259322 RepID=UPI0025FE9C07|nr:hypothetical protein [uncultured Chryseobacterium sp.]
MITKAVEDLFSFIDFLHSKKNYLLSKQNLIDEFNGLLEERNSLKPNSNYRAKIAYDKIQLEIEEKFVILKEEVITPIEEKIIELNIADISTPIINLNARAELLELQRKFDESDLERIFDINFKYFDFKKNTNNYHFYLPFFFVELERDLESFITFFDVEEQDIGETAIFQPADKNSSPEFENLKEILAFFLVPGVKEENEQLFFKSIIEHRIRTTKEDEKIYAIKFLIDEVIALQENNRLLNNPSSYYQAKIDRFVEYCNKEILYLQEKIKDLQLEQSAKYEQSIRIYKKASLEDAERLRCSEGEIYSVLPEPTNYEEAIERFKELDGRRSFELLRMNFLKKYGNTPTLKVINDELLSIYKFISEANQASTEKAFKNQDHSDHLEYLRLENKFYQNTSLPFGNYFNFFNSNSQYIYGKYFLYKDWLEQLQKQLSEEEWISYMKALSHKEREEILQKAQGLKRLAEISLIYAQDEKWSVANYPAELESISRVDLFIEYLSQIFEIFIKEGKDVHHLLDILIQTSKTDFDNPLLTKNKSTNGHLYNKLQSLKLLFSTVTKAPLVDQDIENQNSIVKEKIENLLKFMLTVDPRKHKKILSESDYDKLINWVEYYFINDLQIPLIDSPIKFVNTAKGNVVYTFMVIFKELKPNMTRPDSLFDLVKACFYEYKAAKVSSLKKLKEPQYYKDLNKHYSKNIK